MKQFLCELLFSCLVAVPAARPIDDLVYGTALYAYYQEDYEQALVDVLVAQRQGRQGDEPLRFELAKGSFAFQQGMYGYAADTFAAVDAAALSDLDRMRLAFHLAREHHRRGAWGALESELARLEPASPARGRGHPEVSFMRAEAAIARGDHGAAEAALAVLDARDPQLAYGLFNLGVARRHGGDPTGAAAAFARLAELRPRSTEAWDVVQRGRLALAVLSREQGAATTAQTLLAALPGEGRHRDPALASYARLAMAQEDHELAARIWLTLIARAQWSDSHAEAYLGLPTALERLSGPGVALPRYRSAEQVFADRLAALDSAADRARDSGWILELLAAFAAAAEDDAPKVADLDAGLGFDGWISWLAEEPVHQLLTEWHELDAMAAWLAALPERLAALEAVKGERRRRSTAAGEMLAAHALERRRDAVAARVAALHDDLASLARDQAEPSAAWMLRLANPEERRLIERLGAMSELAGAHAQGPEHARLTARIDRLTGLLFWQIADARSVRVRELQRRLAAARLELEDIDRRVARLDEAEARFAGGVEADFDAVGERAVTLAQRVHEARLDREQALAQALEQRLEQDRERTRQYLLATRVAIARTTDRLAAGGAPPAALPGGES